MTPEWNILEDILKIQKPIDTQIQSAEQELAALDEKRKALQARIKKLKGQKQSIADEQLSFDRLMISAILPKLGLHLHIGISAILQIQ